MLRYRTIRASPGFSKPANTCAKIYLGEDPIKDSGKEKYLGDYVTTLENPKATIQDRKNGYSILSEMIAIL